MIELCKFFIPNKSIHKIPTNTESNNKASPKPVVKVNVDSIGVRFGFAFKNSNRKSKMCKLSAFSIFNVKINLNKIK